MKIKSPFKNLLFILLVNLLSCSSPGLQEHIGPRTPASFQTCLSILNSMINYKIPIPDAFDRLLISKSLKDLEASYGDTSLIEIQKKLNESDIITNNKNLQKILTQGIEFKPIAGKKNYVTADEGEVIYKAMKETKVNVNHDCYDPDGTIGFCFGRATIVHMEAIIRNVHPEAIKKIWIAGDMGKWGHHVAGMVKGEKGWLVLDTDLEHAVSTDEWVAKFMPDKPADAKEIMVFVTQAGRFGPYSTESYNAVDLFNTKNLKFNKAQDYYRGYFHDYFEELDSTVSPMSSPQIQTSKANE